MRLDAALAEIRHRGPDGEGKLRVSEFGFAHARLSIIDLTEAARQPMVDRTGRFVLLFNGEIYNYRELAAAYFPDDHSLNRNSDSAVLLAMYTRFGRECLQHLNGMFAFTVVDLAARSVFMARDRVGEKPLYWVKTPDCLAFASEIGALRRLIPDADWSIDPEALVLYHSVGSVPAPYTIYRAARALRPANWMLFDAQGRQEVGTYWEPAGYGLQQPLDREEAIIACRGHLINAVRSRLVSDVPVGVFLSGGLDSGSILSLCHALGNDAPEALCIDFPDVGFSEYRLAAQTAKKFGARLHRSLVTPTEFNDNLDDFFSAADQPTTDGFNTYFVSLHAKGLGIKVWLSGVGGDELFGGYRSFRRLAKLSRLSSALQHAPLSVMARAWIEHWFPHRLRLARLANLSQRGNQAVRAYQTLRNTLPAGIVANYLLSPHMRHEAGQAQQVVDGIYPDPTLCKDDFQRASLLETTVYMASQLLRDIDNFSMAHSIEVRAPFLDHRLFEYVFALPSAFKSEAGRIKPLLLDALERSLPQAVLSQPKRGFTFPIETWLRRDLASTFESHVLDPHNAEFWDLDAVRRIWQAHLAGRVHWSVPWQFYAFARWHQRQHA